MKIRFVLSFSTILLSIFLLNQVAAQVEQARGRKGDPEFTSTVFGDFKINEANAGSNKPAQYRILLTSRAGQIVAQQSVSNNGRYYFNNVSNGEYMIVVEMDGTAVQSIPLIVQPISRTEIRRDIELEWQNLGKSIDSKAALRGYSRTSANQNTFDKALSAAKNNDNKQAIALLNQIVGSDTKDYEAWTELGTAYFKQEKYGDAEKAYRSALTTKPDFLLALLNLGKTQLTQKNPEGAVETLTKAVETDPKSPPANYFLGEAYLQIKKGSKAVGYLNEAIKLDPIGMADAHLRLGALYRAAGMKDRAVAEFEMLLSKKPNHPDKEALQKYINENKQK